MTKLEEADFEEDTVFVKPYKDYTAQYCMNLEDILDFVENEELKQDVDDCLTGDIFKKQ